MQRRAVMLIEAAQSRNAIPVLYTLPLLLSQPIEAAQISIIRRDL
jgi:hypothetical protein